MFNASTSQKPLFEIAQLSINATKEFTNAYTQLLSATSKICCDTLTACCKVGEESAQQATKTANK